MSIKHQPGFLPWDRSGNPILVHSELGKSKPTHYDIPEEHFTYGKNTEEDPEKINSIIYKWASSHQSDNKNNGRIKDFLATNKAALRNNATTSSAHSSFRKTMTHFKTFKEGSNEICIKLPEENFTYGKPGDLEDPIKLVLANDYGETDRHFRHTMYQNRTEQTPKRKLSCHITKNHKLLKEANSRRLAMFEGNLKEGTNADWKLSKFRETSAKVNTRRPTSHLK